MKRVMIVGQPGSGKSTLARILGDKTGLPVFHIDREIHWLPNWVERDPAQKTPLVHAIHAKQEWIFEGGNSTTFPERLARADMLIWLDLPIWMRLRRVTKRTWQTSGQVRPDMADDCPERFDATFFKWIWNTRTTGRGRMEKIYHKCPPEKRKYRLTNQREIDAFIETF